MSSRLIAVEDVIGKISPPPGVEKYGNDPSGGGLIILVSNLIRVGTVVAGIWVMINFILAGYDYVTSAGDTGAHKRVVDRVTMSVIGLALIATSYTIAALIGAIIFGDPTYIINPKICGPKGC